MKYVSFDYDGTLTVPEVQEYAKELMARGFEVHVTTAREGFGGNTNPFLEDWNQDLYKTIESLGIPKENITYCRDENKFLNFREDFIFHLDDNEYEISRIKTHSDIGVEYSETNWKGNWKVLCENKIRESLI